MDYNFIQFVSIIFGILGSIAGIIGTVYGIKRKRELIHSQLKTEQVKRSAYRSTKQAKDMEKTKNFVDAVKSFLDWFDRK
ncbi:MAG: hypothetical protein ACT4N1_05675 [Nitrososphaerota archaeon]